MDIRVSRSRTDAIIPAMVAAVSGFAHTLMLLLSSPWVGFLLKFFGGGAAMFFGLIGLGADIKDKDGALTPKGRLARKGIIIGGALAIASVIFDFGVAQKSAQEEKEKSERLMLSVQRAVYPLRGITGELTISFRDNIPMVAEYETQLSNAACSKTADYSCEVTNHGSRVYGILGKSRMFPKPNSPLGRVFKSLGAGVSFIKTVDAPEGISQKQLGYFEFAIAQSSPEDFQLTIDMGTHTLSYTTRVRIPDEIAHSANIYSLVETFPGFVAADATFSDYAFCSPRPNKGDDGCPSPITSPFKDGMQLEEIALVFPYPAALLVRRTDINQCLTRAEGHLLLLALPSSVDQTDGFGYVIPANATKDDFAKVCSALNAAENANVHPLSR